MGKMIWIVFAMMFLCPVLGLNADEQPGFSVTPYGYVKLDAVYETGSSSHGNYIIWAANPGDSDGLFHATANQTRLGLKIAAGKIGSFSVNGVVEIDFYGGGAENKAFNYMRQGYLELKNDKWTIIAGQTWDIINPLNPSTLNYAVMWACGNIGYRRPQLSVKHTLTTGKTQLTFQAGILRTIAGDLDNDGIDDGTAEAMPTLQGRLAARIPFNKDGSLQIGLSGHSGNSQGKVPYDSHSLNVDLSLVFSKRLQLLGEFYRGKNMLPYMGAIAQGTNAALQTEIESSGFYAAIQAALTDKLKVNAGFGQDKPDEETLSPGNRSKNTALYANAVYSLNKALAIGFEILHVATDYLGADTRKTTRFQNSWTLSF